MLKNRSQCALASVCRRRSTEKGRKFFCVQIIVPQHTLAGIYHDKRVRVDDTEDDSFSKGDFLAALVLV